MPAMLRKPAILFVLGLFSIPACTNRQQAYPDVPPEQLWTAMKAAAREPTYRDWIVIENSVAVDETDHQIEVYRELRRDFVSPSTPPRREEQSWRFAITMDAPPPPKPPKAEFVSRTAGVPSHAWDEADRFFADVQSLLDGASIGASRPTPTTVVTPSAGLPPPISVPPSAAQPLPPNPQSNPPPNPQPTPGERPSSPPVDLPD